MFTVPTDNQKKHGQRKKLLLEEYLDFFKKLLAKSENDALISV